MTNRCPKCGTPINPRTGRCSMCGYVDKRSQANSSPENQAPANQAPAKPASEKRAPVNPAPVNQAPPKPAPDRRAPAKQPYAKPAYSKPNPSKPSSPKTSTNKTLRTVIIVTAAVLVFCVAFTMLVAFKVIPMPAFGDGKMSYGVEKEGSETSSVVSNPNEVDKPGYLNPDQGMDDAEIQNNVEKEFAVVDADEYFNEIGNVTGKVDVYQSKTVTNENDTQKAMKDRGFENCPILSNYNKDGELIEEEKVGSSSYSFRPVYYVRYIDGQNRQWVIYITDGTVTATLASYGLDNPDSVPLYLSETGDLVGYDNHSSSYYHFTPNSDKATVKKVSKITADTLEKFTI